MHKFSNFLRVFHPLVMSGGLDNRESKTSTSTKIADASDAALRGVCVGRTEGMPVEFSPDPEAQVAMRTCEVAGCQLQARLDSRCLAASRLPTAPSRREPAA